MSLYPYSRHTNLESIRTEIKSFMTNLILIINVEVFFSSFRQHSKCDLFKCAHLRLIFCSKVQYSREKMRIEMNNTWIVGHQRISIIELVEFIQIRSVWWMCFRRIIHGAIIVLPKLRKIWHFKITFIYITTCVKIKNKNINKQSAFRIGTHSFTWKFVHNALMICY